MTQVTITREDFLRDRQGRTFRDVANDLEARFQTVLDFFSDEGRQRRMEESEIHHDRPALAGVVRELECQPPIDAFLASSLPGRAKRLRQAVGVTVRMVMERRGWMKTGKKGCLGVRAPGARQETAAGAVHNTGGLAFWFLRAERYAIREGMPFVSVRDRAQRLCASSSQRSPTQGEAMT
ncbi:MAG: hypothetical protein ABR915_02740 [Thermoguttaceae bacterium]|jgi:hypothetical protein